MVLVSHASYIAASLRAACGSLREELAPGHLITIDQFIDRTTKRASTFYDGSAWEELPGRPTPHLQSRHPSLPPTARSGRLTLGGRSRDGTLMFTICCDHSVRLLSLCYFPPLLLLLLL